MATAVYTSQPSKFEFGVGNPTETLINLIPVTFTAGHHYRFGVFANEIEIANPGDLVKSTIQIAGYVLPTGA
jgi:hypothetical protein